MLLLLSLYYTSDLRGDLSLVDAVENKLSCLEPFSNGNFDILPTSCRNKNRNQIIFNHISSINTIHASIGNDHEIDLEAHIGQFLITRRFLLS